MENTFKGLNKMADTVYRNNVSKGFWDNERNTGETLMLIVTELAEALEAHRKGMTAMPPMDIPEGATVSKEDFERFYKDTYEDEIADALIRIFDLCGGTGIDLEWHVSQKVNYNKQRPRLHGKQY